MKTNAFTMNRQYNQTNCSRKKFNSPSPILSTNIDTIGEMKLSLKKYQKDSQQKKQLLKQILTWGKTTYQDPITITKQDKHPHSININNNTTASGSTSIYKKPLNIQSVMNSKRPSQNLTKNDIKTITNAPSNDTLITQPMIIDTNPNAKVYNSPPHSPSLPVPKSVPGSMKKKPVVIEYHSKSLKCLHEQKSQSDKEQIAQLMTQINQLENELTQKNQLVNQLSFRYYNSIELSPRIKKVFIGGAEGEEGNNGKSHKVINENKGNDKQEVLLEQHKILLLQFNENNKEISLLQKKSSANDALIANQLNKVNQTVNHFHNTLNALIKQREVLKSTNDRMRNEANNQGNTLVKITKKINDLSKEIESLKNSNTDLVKNINEKNQMIDALNERQANITSYEPLITEPNHVSQNSQMTLSAIDDNKFKAKIDDYKERMISCKDKIQTQNELITMLKEDYKKSQEKMNDIDIFNNQLIKIFNQAFENYYPKDQEDIESFQMIKHFLNSFPSQLQ